MRGLVFSDPHIHPYKAFSHVDKMGVNSRLGQILDVVARLVQLALEPDIDFVLIPGDVFHDKDRVYVRAYAETIALLGMIQVPTLFVTGNHDFVSKENGKASFSATRIMKEMGSQFYLDEEMTVTKGAESLTFFGIPYMEDIEEQCRAIKAVPRDWAIVTHAEVALATDRQHLYRTGIPGRLLDEFVFSVVGHIHTPQTLGSSILVPGSPVHHDFGDAGRQAYAWVIDSKHGDTVFTPFDVPGPRFYTLTKEEFKSFGKPGPEQFVRVTGEAEGEEIENVVFLPNLGQSALSEGRGGVTLSNSKRELLDKWLCFKGIKKDFDSYLEYGEKLL